MLTGSAPDPIGHEAKAAHETNTSKLYDRIFGYARFLLEHPPQAAPFNGGIPIESEAALIAATKAYCRYKRMPGYGEGRTLVNACASAWHLHPVRQALLQPAAAPQGRRRRRPS